MLVGLSFSYRGAVIDCQKGEHVCALKMPDHPLHRHGFGVVGTVTPLVDLWLEERRLPSYTRVVPKRQGWGLARAVGKKTPPKQAAEEF